MVVGSNGGDDNNGNGDSKVMGVMLMIVLVMGK